MRPQCCPVVPSAPFQPSCGVGHEVQQEPGLGQDTVESAACVLEAACASDSLRKGSVQAQARDSEGEPSALPCFVWGQNPGGGNSAAMSPARGRHVWTHLLSPQSFQQKQPVRVRWGHSALMGPSPLAGGSLWGSEHCPAASCCPAPPALGPVLYLSCPALCLQGSLCRTCLLPWSFPVQS